MATIGVVLVLRMLDALPSRGVELMNQVSGLALEDTQYTLDPSSTTSLAPARQADPLASTWVAPLTEVRFSARSAFCRPHIPPGSARSSSQTTSEPGNTSDT